MKKHYLMLSAALLVAGAAHAQGTELFFSEYGEGSRATGTSYCTGCPNSTGSERAIEIYNPTISAEAKGLGREKLTLNIPALKPGIYFVQILSAGGQTKIYKKELVVP